MFHSHLKDVLSHDCKLTSCMSHVLDELSLFSDIFRVPYSVCVSATNQNAQCHTTRGHWLNLTAVFNHSLLIQKIIPCIRK
jgi:hypothetical protein